MRRFQQNRAAAAHRIEQRNAGEPSGKAKNPGGEIFPQRRFSRGYALAALEQRLPRGVEIKGKVAICQMTLDANIGLTGIHAGTAAQEPANSIAHCVLDFEGDEVETCEGTPDGRDVDFYSESRFKSVVPWQR